MPLGLTCQAFEQTSVAREGSFLVNWLTSGDVPGELDDKPRANVHSSPTISYFGRVARLLKILRSLAITSGFQRRWIVRSGDDPLPGI
jgi:hypothetical protein